MLDLALAYDSENACFDLVYQPPYLLLDTTAATPLLLALGTNRRAQPGDALPDVSADPNAPSSLVQRGGTPLDALDRNGALWGSRLFLLANAKSGGDLGEETRKRAEGYVAEPLNQIEPMIGPTQLQVTWLSSIALQIVVRQGPAVLAQLTQPIGTAA